MRRFQGCPESAVEQVDLVHQRIWESGSRRPLDGPADERSEPFVLPTREYGGNDSKKTRRTAWPPADLRICPVGQGTGVMDRGRNR